ncbi:hypothetical protein ACLK1T_04255 [Escherichia coli]
MLAVLIAPERKPIEESNLNVQRRRPPHADGGNQALLILLWGEWVYQRLIINVINDQAGVVLRRRHVIQTLGRIGQLSDQWDPPDSFYALVEHFPRLAISPLSHKA